YGPDQACRKGQGRGRTGCRRQARRAFAGRSGSQAETSQDGDGDDAGKKEAGDGGEGARRKPGEPDDTVAAGAARAPARAETDKKAGDGDEGQRRGDRHRRPAAGKGAVEHGTEEEARDEAGVDGDVRALCEPPDDAADAGDPTIERQQQEGGEPDQHAAEKGGKIRSEEHTSELQSRENL